MRKSSRRKSGKKPRGRIIIKRKGDLTGLGYSTKKSASSRRKSLTRAKNRYGYGSVVKKVNALCILNKNRSPKTSAIFCSDKKWLMSNYGKKRKTPRKTPRIKSRMRKSYRKKKANRK